MASEIRLEKDPLTPELVEKARKELRETPENREKGLTDLRKLLKEKKDIYISDRDDVLERYLRPTKYYAESALELIIRECDFKKKYSSVLKDLMPATLSKVLQDDDCPVNILTGRDQFGRRILVAQCGKRWITDKCSADEYFQIFYLLHEAALLEPATQVNGIVVIMDFAGLGLTQLPRFTPAVALRLLTFIQKAMPLRLKGVHIINQPGIFSMVWKLFKPFIEKKLNDRLFFHGEDMAALHKHIDPNFLPADFGGKLPKVNYGGKEWYPLCKSIEPTFTENNTFGFRK